MKVYVVLSLIIKRHSSIGFTVKVHILICVKSGTVGTAQRQGETLHTDLSEAVILGTS